MISLLGLLLIISPFILGFANNLFALWSYVFLGASVLAISFFEEFGTETEGWEFWLGNVIGVLIIVDPFVIGFSHIVQALWVSRIIGLLLFVITGVQIYFYQKITEA